MPCRKSVKVYFIIAHNISFCLRIYWIVRKGTKRKLFAYFLCFVYVVFQKLLRKLNKLLFTYFNSYVTFAYTLLYRWNWYFSLKRNADFAYELWIYYYFMCVYHCIRWNPKICWCILNILWKAEIDLNSWHCSYLFAMFFQSEDMWSGFQLKKQKRGKSLKFVCWILIEK